MDKVGEIEITMSDEAKATFEKLAEALDRFSALCDVFDRLAAALTAAREACVLFPPAVVNNCIVSGVSTNGEHSC